MYVADFNTTECSCPSGQTTASLVYGQYGSYTNAYANNNRPAAAAPPAPAASTIHLVSQWTPTTSSMCRPVGGLTLEVWGTLYICDWANHRVLTFAPGATFASRVYGQAGSFTYNTDNLGGSVLLHLSLRNATACGGGKAGV